MSAKDWTNLFYEALPRLHELSRRITKQRNWHFENLLALILNRCKVPYLGIKTSRLAIRWMYELVPGLITNMQTYDIPVDSLVYRVSSRLGIIDPNQDKYSGDGSPADQKIQTFIRNNFPERPWIVDEPLWSTGRKASDGGCCFPQDPNCIKCMFDPICPKKFLDIVPNHIGITGEFSGPKLICGTPVIRNNKSNTKKQREFSKFIEELKIKGIKGVEFRDARDKWNREHKDD